ncbi:MAG: electron transfer flavoprotein subunit alpha/FixB family protein [Ruminococcaceae bacterium]|nr:electron transfer flavoprotein subunit alpha/FixB family protein [Oscillospiraceae bacterium]
MSKNVFVVVVQHQGAIRQSAAELMGEAARLAADLGQQAVAVLLGHDVARHAQDLIQWGADEVLVVDHPVLESYTTEPYVKSVSHVIGMYEPQIVLFSADSIGRDMAPRIAARVHTGLTADCIRLDVDGEQYRTYLQAESSLRAEEIEALELSGSNLKMTMPAFGGNAMATILCPDHRPQMATVRPGVLAVPAKDPARTGKITVVDVGLSPADRHVEILESTESEKQSVDIAAAGILVAGGRGVGGPEGFEALHRLAEVLGGEVASSRIEQNDWVEKARQVGQTGKTVRPDLYLACGISGAIQHMVGMEHAGRVIAINKDATCPMMKRADLGIVGDLQEILPKLTEAIAAYQAEKAAR